VSRNSKKINRQPAQSQTKPETKPKLDLSSLSNLSFVVSTEEVALPSRGKFYKKESPLCGLEKIEIRHMTAKEEDLLSNTTDKNSENLFDKLVNSILVDKTITAEMLLEEDKMAILLKARETGYGKTYTTLVYCEKCDSTTPVDFDLSRVGIREPLSKSEYDPESDCFSFHLEMMDIDVKLKRVTTAEREALKKDQEKKTSLDLEFNYTLEFLKKCIVSFEETRDPAIIAKVIELMPARDAKSIMEFEMTCMPKLDTTQEITCGKCGNVAEREVPFSWAFFRTDV
tara:strand:- start:257 stop:1111 length:855 start_codon:yes stop_codon:yes gene_type:complete